MSLLNKKNTSTFKESLDNKCSAVEMIKIIWHVDVFVTLASPSFGYSDVIVRYAKGKW